MSLSYQTRASPVNLAATNAAALVSLRELTFLARSMVRMNHMASAGEPPENSGISILKVPVDAVVDATPLGPVDILALLGLSLELYLMKLWRVLSFVLLSCHQIMCVLNVSFRE